MTLSTVHPTPVLVGGPAPSLLSRSSGESGPSRRSRPALFPVSSALPPRPPVALDNGRRGTSPIGPSHSVASPRGGAAAGTADAPSGRPERRTTAPGTRRRATAGAPTLSLVPDPRPAALPAGALPEGTSPEKALPASARPTATPRSAQPGRRQPREGAAVDAAPVSQAVRDLLADAGRGLGRAIGASTPADRYAIAHLAALRAAAAVLAARARPVRGRRGSAWELMTRVAPDLGEWAAFFAAGSAKRRAAEAGLATNISAREADDMIRQVAAFLELAEGAVQRG